MARTKERDDEVEPVKLSDAAEYLLEESRMVLPGIQALFGFQLIAVFSNGFKELTIGEQRLHFAAISLVVIAVAIIMTPAAYHRQQSPHEITGTFVVVSTRLLLLSMPPLALAICLDFYLIARIIIPGLFAPIVPTVMLGLFFLLWFVLPRARGFQRWLGRDGRDRR
jgi:hypothetical protein